MRGAIARGRGVPRDEARLRVRGVLSDMGGLVNQSIYARGVKLYNRGHVHETGDEWVFRVGSDAGGLYGYEVDLSVGSCTCKAYRLQGYICYHVVAAGAAWVAKHERGVA